MARLIQFEGRQISLPDDATDAEVAQALGGGTVANMSQSGSPPSPYSAANPYPGAVPAPPNSATGQQWFEGPPLTPPLPGTDLRQGPTSLKRGLQIGTQGTGAGLAELVSMPFDLAAGGQNLLVSLVNRALGTNIPMATPASSMLKSGASAIAEAGGVPTIDPETMTTKEKFAYNINRFGTQAAGAIPALAGRAATRTAEIAAGSAPKAFDALVKPYAGENIGRTVVGDAAAAAGAGTGVTLADEAGYQDNPLVQTLAALGGGVGGVTTLGALRGAGRTAVQRVPGLGVAAEKLGFPQAGNVDKDVSSLANKDFRTDAPVRREVSDTVANVLQQRAAYKNSGARLQENAAALRAMDAEAPMPSPAALSEDHGLRQLETALAMKNPAAITRNREFNSSVRDSLDRSVPADADPSALVSRVQSVADERVGAATRRADRATEREATVAGIRQEDAATGVTPFAGQRTAASERLDRSIIDEGYLPARAEKNRQFDTAPGRTQQLPADDVFDAAEAVRAQNNALRPDNQLPEEFMRRLEALAPRMEQQQSAILDEFGRPVQREVNVGGPGTALGGDLADTRKYISTSIERARATGNFDMATSLSRLGAAINRTIEAAPGYAEANANYAGFADTYRPNPKDPAAEFTRKIDRTPGRGDTPPSATAKRFIQPGAPEKQQALRRMMDASENPAGRTASRQYLLADMADFGVINSDGTLNSSRLQDWRVRWGDVDTVAPGLEQEVADLTGRAAKGERVAAMAKKAAKTAERGVQQTQRDIDKSALGRVLNADPDKAIEAVMGDKTRINRSMDELIEAIGDDKDARNGLKAAIGRYIADRTTTNAVEKLRPGDRRAPVSQAALNELLDDPNTAKALAKVFSPEEMNIMRAAQRSLNLANLERLRVSSGSDTVEKASSAIDQFLRTPLGKGTEAALRVKYGLLKAGGLVATTRRLTSSVTTGVDPDEVARVLNEAMANPELMGLLLGRKLPVASPMWNKKVLQLLAVAEGARDSGPTEQK